MAEPVQRDVSVQGLAYVVRAVPQADGAWRATVAGMTTTAGAGDAIANLGRNPLGIMGGAEWVETGADAEAAIEALAQRIRSELTTAVARAKQERLDEANRQLQERNARKRPPWEG